MIDRSLFNVEDFLVDNTFQLYCAGKDKLCIIFWENYIKAHPEQKEIIAEAKRLYFILSGNKKSLDKQLDQLKNNIASPSNSKVIPIGKSYTWLKIAIAVLVLISIAFYFQQSFKKTSPNTSLVAHFNAKDGERKKITLRDGSVILLNSRSSLTLDESFNTKNREVNLIGEALFDVTSNKSKPFVVHTADFDINVLGTTFNVKAYPGEATSEAVLIKGSIVMEGKGNKGNSITLKPSQKVTFYKKTKAPLSPKSPVQSEQLPEIVISQYVKTKDSTIVEMAWTQNKLEIIDQTFSEVKDVLERWYNVDIKIINRDVEKYRFTATFNNENIREVLNALQKAEYFKYEIKGNQITISK